MKTFFVLFRRAHSVSDDVSSELQRIAAMDREMNSSNPFCRRGGLSRYGGWDIVSTGKGNFEHASIISAHVSPFHMDSC